MKNYADRGGCYPPKPKAEADNTLRDLHNSSYHTKAEFNNCFIIHSKYFQRAVALSKYRKASFEVSKFGFHFLAVIRIALENRRIVNSKAHFVALRR